MVIGTKVLTDPFVGRQPPSATGLPITSSDPRNADPCALINLDSLRPFGDPRFATPPFLESCQVSIAAAGNAETHLQVIFYRSGGSVFELGESRQVSGLPVVRKDRVGVAGTTGCQDWLAPAGQLWATITVFPYRDGSEDLCAVTEAATSAAAETLARNGGVPAKPNRNTAYSLTLADACAALDDTTLTKVPGLDPSRQFPGFANWSCSWGTEDIGTRVQLHFGLRDSFDDLGDPSTPTAGKTTYRVDEPGSCTLYVVHRPARTDSAVAEVFLLNVTTTRPEVDACNQAADLAPFVEEELRRNPRDADPCALINLDSLRPFGEPQFTTPPWLQSCQAAIEALERDGGITYTPRHTTLYSHAGSDACALLDNTALAQVSGLDPDDRFPGYANWTCDWGYQDEGPGVSLYFRLEEAELSDYYLEELQRVTVAEKPAFLNNSEEQSCSAHVVHRSTPTATEMLEIHVEAPRTIDELCTLATDLATTAEQHLPEG